MTRSGALPSAACLAMAEATGSPGKLPPRSPVAYTLVAPWAPRVSAIASASPPPYTASTVSPSSRAFVSISSVMGATLPSAASARTQMRFRAIAATVSYVSVPVRPRPSDDLEVLEEGDDLGVALAVVLDDLPGLTGRRLVHSHDVLTGAGRAHGGGVDAQVGQRQLIDRLGLGGHDPLEARVAGLHDAGRHRHHCRQGGLHVVLRERGLPLALHRPARH